MMENDQPMEYLEVVVNARKFVESENGKQLSGCPDWYERLKELGEDKWNMVSSNLNNETGATTFYFKRAYIGIVLC